MERIEWWTDHTNLAALYKWLTDNGELDENSTADVVYFLSKPWKWSPEWERMHGRVALLVNADAEAVETLATTPDNDGVHR